MVPPHRPRAKDRADKRAADKRAAHEAAAAGGQCREPTFADAGADTRPAQRLPGQLPGVDAGRLRLLRPGLCPQGRGQDLPHRQDARRLRHHADAGPAARRRLPLRPGRGPLRAPHPADDRRRLVLRLRAALGLRPDPDLVPGPARPVRDRHGRGVGAGSVPGDGDDPGQNARRSLGPAAGRLRRRLPAGGRRLPLRRPQPGLALDVLCGRPARPAVAVHPRQGQGVACLEGSKSSSSRSSRAGQSGSASASARPCAGMGGCSCTSSCS